MIILCVLVDLAVLVLLARMVLSWFPIGYGSSAGSVYRGLVALTEPLLAPVRRLVRPVVVGGVALDLAPVLLIGALALVASVVC